jgi:hypothetical protein
MSPAAREPSLSKARPELVEEDDPERAGSARGHSSATSGRTCVALCAGEGRSARWKTSSTRLRATFCGSKADEESGEVTPKLVGCEFRRIPARDSDLMSATVPI